MVNIVAETLFRVLSSITSVSVTLSMVPSMYRIYKKKDTGIASVLPLVCMVANAHVWMLDGIITKNWFPVFATFLTSDILAIIYVTTFFCFARDRKKALERIIIGATILGFITVYAILGHAGYTNQSKDGVETTMGILGVSAGVSMYSSPFERMRKVVRHKSAAFIPIPMVAVGALNNVMWIVYSPMISSWFLFSGNVMCLSVGFVNLVLYIMYNPKTHPLRLDHDDPDAVPVNFPGVQSLPDEGDVESKSKQTLHSPVYTMIHSPTVGTLSDISNRV